MSPILILTLTIAMTLVGAALGIARARRAAAGDVTVLSLRRVGTPPLVAVRWAGLCLLLLGGAGVQMVEAFYPPLSRVALLSFALPLGLALAAAAAPWLARNGCLLPGLLVMALATPALTYALLAAINGAGDGAAGIARHMTIVETHERVLRNGVRRHVIVLDAADRSLPRMELTVDTPVETGPAVLTTYPGLLGVPWSRPSRDLRVAPY
jgi:hypothetical protein